MKKINKLLFVIPFVLLLFACGKKTQKENTTTTKTNKTTNNITSERKKDLCTVKFDLNNGIGNIDDVTVEKGNKITKPKDPTREFYTFDGWYYEDSKWLFDFHTVPSDITLKANWIFNKYSITLDNQVDGLKILGITSGNKYDYNSEVTLIAKNIPSNYTIKWSRSDGEESQGDEYTFNVPLEDISITTTLTRPYKREGNKIYLGTYPQTRVTDDTLVSELNALAGTLPTPENLYSWTDYNYLIGGKVESYMYYNDIDYDNDGAYDYRGVYFIKYRPGYCFVTDPESPYQLRNNYKINEVYWFSYEPIEWEVFTESDGKALIISHLILDCQEFYPSESEEEFEHNGGIGYANNYELSNIRKWINETFYNTAFTDLQKALIEITTVDNSEATTFYQESNPFVCNNTQDKMFLLSYQEAITYYKNQAERQAKGTDYAKSHGLYASEINNGSSVWRLRSPDADTPSQATSAVENGGIGGYHDYICNTNYGIRPACWIKA